MNGLNIPKKITAAVLIVIFIFLVFPYAKSTAEGIKNEVPIMNDAWWNSLIKIKNESQSNAIINSWWDFGHHFKYVADRAVTFDGASQNTPMAHWIGKTLLTSNEKEAIGILRMLDCGSNDAFDILDGVVNDTSVSVKMLYDIILIDKSSAENYLKNKNIDLVTIGKVLQKTHCSPPEDYFIASGDMVGKAGVWGHFGSWDFDKADIWMAVSTKTKEEAIETIKTQLKLSEEDAKKKYYELKTISTEDEANAWIAPWPGYAQQIGCSKQDNSILICGGVTVDLTTKDTNINTDKGTQKPYSIVYSENNEFYEKKFDSELQQSIILLQEGNNYKIVVASPETAISTFTKLYFYNGVGMKQFKKFTEETQITGEKIIVWKIEW
jgi:asparagine N-glycosylation enzyme membrane subunit Stt3